MQDLLNSAARKPWLRRPRFLITAAIVILCAGWFSRFAYLRITLRPTPRPEYWEAKLAELNPPPPNAISSQEASKILTSRPFEIDPVITAVPQFEISDLLLGDWDVNRPDIAAGVKMFESKDFLDARGELQRALKMGWSDRVNLDIHSITFPSYVDYRAWAKWLVARSRWSWVRGDAEAAVEDWLTVFRLSRQVQRQKVLIAYMVGMAISSLAAHEIIIASQEKLEAIDVAKFVEQVNQILGNTIHAAHLLRGEEIYLQNVLEYYFVREDGDWIDVSAFVITSNNAGLTALAPGTQLDVSRIWNLASPLFHDYQTARSRVHDVYAAFDECKNMVECRETELRTEKNVQARLTVLDGVVSLPSGSWSVMQAPIRYYRSQCFIEAALATLAIHQYHRTKGQYPESLPKLVPDFLPRIPIDYADGRPLRYRQVPEGYLLYSVGEDGRDDGGRFDQRNPANFDPGFDAVFSKIKRRELSK